MPTAPGSSSGSAPSGYGGAPASGYTQSQRDIDRAPGAAVHRLTYTQARTLMQAVDPGQINEACAQWASAARQLGDLANRLKAEAAQPLSEAWKATAAQPAQQSLQMAEATARELANQCMQMATATDAAYRHATAAAGEVQKGGYLHHPEGPYGPAPTSALGGMTMTAHVVDQKATDHVTALTNGYNDILLNVIPAQVRESYLDPNTAS